MDFQNFGLFKIKKEVSFLIYLAVNTYFFALPFFGSSLVITSLPA
jgi:hypothetical protein